LRAGFVGPPAAIGADGESGVSLGGCGFVSAKPFPRNTGSPAFKAIQRFNAAFLPDSVGAWLELEPIPLTSLSTSASA
jgi:hypothetical protein